MALDLQVDGKLVVGKLQETGEIYLGLYLDTELPVGIPLWSTGLAAYGFAGVFALHMEPDKGPEGHRDEQWYAIGGDNSYFHRPPVGISSVTEKWRPQAGSLGFGAGVTIGTISDNGFMFSGRVLLVIVFPGPIVLLEGAANLLKERAALRGDQDPNFRALAVLDARAGTVLVGLDARYKFGDEGELIDIGGSAEAFFSFHDASLWHLYIGQKEPRERRIRAEFLSLFESNSYLMLDARQLATGAWLGWDADWRFGPLHVVAQAWIEGNAVISWKPAYFHGDLWLHGGLEVGVFGFEFGLAADAQLAADVFDPFHILGHLGVR
jgi:hypothetical protein